MVWFWEDNGEFVVDNRKRSIYFYITFMTESNQRSWGKKNSLAFRSSISVLIWLKQFLPPNLIEFTVSLLFLIFVMPFSSNSGLFFLLEDLKKCPVRIEKKETIIFDTGDLPTREIRIGKWEELSYLLFPKNEGKYSIHFFLEEWSTLHGAGIAT